MTRLAMERAVTTGRKGLGAVWMVRRFAVLCVCFSGGLIYWPLQWAAGNGGDDATQDECNFDGYTNNPLTISVGAVTDGGVKASYSEECAALMVVAPSSGGTKGITTCDILGADGYDPSDCTNTFGGTSSAAPLASGVVAVSVGGGSLATLTRAWQLMLAANPRLGWKDVQYLLMTTAQRVDPNDSSWMKNGGTTGWQRAKFHL